MSYWKEMQKVKKKKKKIIIQGHWVNYVSYEHFSVCHWGLSFAVVCSSPFKGRHRRKQFIWNVATVLVIKSITSVSGWGWGPCRGAPIVACRFLERNGNKLHWPCRGSFCTSTPSHWFPWDQHWPDTELCGSLWWAEEQVRSFWRASEDLTWPFWSNDLWVRFYFLIMFIHKSRKPQERSTLLKKTNTLPLLVD